jgi:hypothetical protein
LWHPIRRALGATGVALNAYSAAATGDALIERHDALPPAPYDYWYAAEPVSAAGEHDRAIEIASEGLADRPLHPLLHYQLACYNALGGHRSDAVVHLRIAYREDRRTREWAAGDADLDSVRDDPALD